MQPDQAIQNLSSKLEAALSHFREEIAKLRTGRAHPGVLDQVMVQAYGVSMPLKQVANVIAPEAQLIQVTPFDSNNLQAIASAIRDDQSLGLNPVDDGIVIRIQVPSLTAERRAEIVKQLNQKSEATLITMRSNRHEVIKDLDEAKKQKQLSEDDYKRVIKQIDEKMNGYKDKVDELTKNKTHEITTI
jgi:ribosome recycling factor